MPVAVNMDSGKKKSKKSKKLADMSVDEFLGAEFDSESSSSSKSNDMELSKKKLTKKKPIKDVGKMKVEKKVSTNEPNKSKKKSTSDDTVKEKNKSTKASAKSDKSLAKSLLENDPEFYDFLKGEDKSLLTNLAGLSDDCSDEDVESDVEGRIEKQDSDNIDFEKEILNMSSGDDSDEEEQYEMPKQLEVASDDSDVDEEEEEEGEGDLPAKKSKKGELVTNKMVNSWSEELKNKPSQFVFRQAVSAFHAAVKEAGGSEDKTVSKYRVEGSSVFNNVVRLCLERIAPCLQAMLQMPTLSTTNSKSLSFEKSKTWKKIKVTVKTYLNDLLELLGQLSEAVMVNAILKHAHKLILFFANFPKVSKLVLKRMIKIWTSGEETTRVLAFLCINKLVRLRQDALFEVCLKQMYMAYVSNCKFTSPTTLPLINFMQTSLVEIFNIDQVMAYQYAFIYIRQLAIHLRNAISVKKKNTCQAVYNWQFIHCLGLWVKLLTSTHPSEILQPMIYPLTQTIIGTIKLLPTPRFYPLRFHCVKLLNNLSSKTDTFIPTLPYLLEVIEQTDFNKRHKTVSMKPFNFAVILKFSKSQLHEKAFKDGLVDQLYELFLESYHNKSCSIGFPEMIIPSVIQLKDFLKKCKIANYCKQFKQIVDKAMEQAAFVTEKRKRSGVRLDDVVAIAQWEDTLKSSGTPLDKYHTSWRKLRDRELLHELSNKESISGAAIDIPVIERRVLNREKKATKQERQDLSKLFENDSDSEDESRFLLKEERPDPKKSNKRKHDGSDSEDYSDFDDDELAKLAGPGDDESGEDSDNIEVETDTDDESEVEEVQIKSKKVNKKKLGSKKPRLEEEDFQDGGDVVEEFNLAEFDSD